MLTFLFSLFGSFFEIIIKDGSVMHVQVDVRLVC